MYVALARRFLQRHIAERQHGEVSATRSRLDLTPYFFERKTGSRLGRTTDARNGVDKQCRVTGRSEGMCQAAGRDFGTIQRC
jgi:hypothetical protein